jgi:hypothetical protein
MALCFTLLRLSNQISAGLISIDYSRAYQGLHSVGRFPSSHEVNHSALLAIQQKSFCQSLFSFNASCNMLCQSAISGKTVFCPPWRSLLIYFETLRSLSSIQKYPQCFTITHFLWEISFSVEDTHSIYRYHLPKRTVPLCFWFKRFRDSKYVTAWN